MFPVCPLPTLVPVVSSALNLRNHPFNVRLEHTAVLDQVLQHHVKMGIILLMCKSPRRSHAKNVLHARWGLGRQPLAVSPQTECAHGALGSLDCPRTSLLVLNANGSVMVDIMAIHAPHVQLIIGAVLDW